MSTISEGFHTGSGNAQVKSPRGVGCDIRAKSISAVTESSRVDRTTEVEAGVNATRSATGPLQCQFCGRACRRACGLAQHLKSCQHRPKEDRPKELSCESCQRTFQRPCGLAQHRKTCTERQTKSADSQINLVCPKCKRCDFKRPCGLGRHIKSCKGTLSDPSYQPEGQSTTTSQSTICSEAHSSPRSSRSAYKTLESAEKATGQQTQHSARDSLADKPFDPTLQNDHRTIKINDPLKVPSAGCRRQWEQIDTALLAVIKTNCPGIDSLPPPAALQQLENAIHFFFSKSQQNTPPDECETKTRHKHQRPTCLKTLRRQLRSLRKQWRNLSANNASPEEAAKLRREFHQIHKRIKRISAQQKTLENSRRLASELNRFRADPYRYGKRAFSSKNNSKPTFTTEMAQEYYPSIFGDTDRGYCYEKPAFLPSVSEANFSISPVPPSFADFTTVLRSRRNSAAPGPNGIPNAIWKRCKCLQEILYSIIRRIWKSGKIPPSWQCATIRLFHKKGATDDPANFRPISLSNSDGKIFFALVSKAISQHMIRNNYFDRRVQKGFLPGIAGCLEHSSLLSEALRDARAHQRSICISWLDLRNAFGSVRHSLILFALEHYQLPPFVCRIVRSYYECLTVMVDVPGTFRTPSIHFAIGAFQGCTLSPVLFNIVIQLALDTLEQPDNLSFGYCFSSDEDTVILNSAYADDLQLVTSMPEQNQYLLNQFDTFLCWTVTMAARPNKCWSVALRKFQEGYHRFDPKLRISMEHLNYLDDNDFRYLGKPVNVRLSESICRKSIIDSLNEWLAITDTLHLPNTAKLWLYQHFVVAKLAWYFNALDLSLTFVRQLQNTVTSFLKKWSGLPRAANTTILFCGTAQRAGLHIKHLETFWKQMQAVRLDLLKHSADTRCQRLYSLLLQRQSTWTRRYSPAVEHACATTVVEANPPTSTSRQKPTARACSQRERILNIIADIDTQAQLTKLRQLSIQGRWLEWTDTMNSDLSWRRLIHAVDDGELRFTMQVITNTAPTPDNLRRWGHQEIDPACVLCGRPCTLRHVLNACSTSLHQGRYTWRHDCVLRTLKRHLLDFWKTLEGQPDKQATQGPFIRFVKEGAPIVQQPHRHDRRPLLSAEALRYSTDWQFLFDVDDGFSVFPPHIAVTRQRPDIIIYSSRLKIVLLIELTVPLEDRVAAAHTIKTKRYDSLLSTCASNGWQAYNFPVEVGCRGFVATSLLNCLRQLGFPSWRAKKVRRECSRVALRASYLLFLRRTIRQWGDDSSMQL